MLKDFLTMTRRERHGTIALLVLIALLLAGTLIVRNCTCDAPVDALTTSSQLFENQADSASAATTRPTRHPRKSTPRRPSPDSKPNPKPKSKPAPRPLTPVPQF